jgi:MinD-like ATPase involved in chromosome partitioning or flagellar assembly
LAALLAKKGYRVLLADFDIYAPSLKTYFGASPKKWINDYLFGNSEVEELMTDFTPILDKDGVAMEKNDTTHSLTNGRLWLAFSNPRKEEIYKLDITAFNTGKHINSNLQILRRFIKLRDEAIKKQNIDYLIIDTSPGIKYWSINCLALADTLILTLKMDDLDIEGTTDLIHEIYDTFSELGAKSYLLLNRVAGYCVPKGLDDVSRVNSSVEQAPANLELDLQVAKRMLSSAAKVEILSAIPCYCDIQFSQKEFLTCINYPNHAFSKQLQILAESEQIKP